MPPKFQAKTKANHNTLAALRGAIVAPAPVNQGAPVPNAKGIAKAKGLQAAHDGYLRVQASAADARPPNGNVTERCCPSDWLDVCSIQRRCLGSSCGSWKLRCHLGGKQLGTDWGSCCDCVGCSLWNTEAESVDIRPAGGVVHLWVSHSDEGDFGCRQELACPNSRLYNFVTGTNHLGLDTSADGDAAVRDFWMKMGKLLCCWCSVRGRRDSIPIVGSSRN